MSYILDVYIPCFGLTYLTCCDNAHGVHNEHWPVVNVRSKLGEWIDTHGSFNANAPCLDLILFELEDGLHQQQQMLTLSSMS
jgi:hypothetical protein